jgi:thioredoxin 1
MKTLSASPVGNYYLYSFDGKLLQTYNVYGVLLKDYIYMGDRLIAEYDHVGSRFLYYTPDQINSTRVVKRRIDLRGKSACSFICGRDKPAGRFDKASARRYHGTRFSPIEPQSQEMNMSDAIIAGSDATFDAEVLKSDLPVLVDFWASWCGPCLMIAPVIEEIAESHKGKLKVIKINVDENNSTPQTYGVMAIPTLILFKGGQVKEKIVGAVAKSKLVDLIAKYS